jgi:hypothetical protein
MLRQQQEQWVAQAETVDGEPVTLEQLQVRRKVLKKQLLQVQDKLAEKDVPEKVLLAYRIMVQEYREVKELIEWERVH